jgi:hypothetical protein
VTPLPKNPEISPFLGFIWSPQKSLCSSLYSWEYHNCHTLMGVSPGTQKPPFQVADCCQSDSPFLPRFLKTCYPCITQEKENLLICKISLKDYSSPPRSLQELSKTSVLPVPFFFDSTCSQMTGWKTPYSVGSQQRPYQVLRRWRLEGSQFEASLGKKLARLNSNKQAGSCVGGTGRRIAIQSWPWVKT